MNDILDYRTQKQRNLSKRFLIILIIAACHLGWAVFSDYIMWYYLHTSGEGKPHPFSITLLPYLPACAVYNWAINEMSNPMTVILLTAGTLIVCGTSIGMGAGTLFLLKGRFAHTRYLRGATLFTMWFGWLIVPAEFSLYFQWFYWRLYLHLHHGLLW